MSAEVSDLRCLYMKADAVWIPFSFSVEQKSPSYVAQFLEKKFGN